VIDEMYPNAVAAGAPVFNRRGAPIATITIVAPKARVNKVAARKLGEMAARTAASVTQATVGLRA
jgi:DNA-binding IclR family transcriptional regulator